MNWRSWLDKPLVWVNAGIFVSCWLFGAYHAWQDHTTNQALVATLFPPYGIWMAIEDELEHRGKIDWQSRGQSHHAGGGQAQHQGRKGAGISDHPPLDLHAQGVQM